MKTKAVVFPDAEKFEMVDLTLDEMGPGDICVRTVVTAISPGTERWILKGKHIGTKFPCVPGYHRIGIVEGCGKDVKLFRPGDIVYGSDNRWKEDIYSMWGAHCGYSVSGVAGYRFLSSVMPDTYELETTVFTTVSAVAYRGISALDVQKGDKLLIIGAGFIGLCAAQLAGIRQASPVFMEADPERIKFAKGLGFPAFSPEEIEQKIKALAPEGVDIIYDTAGVPSAIDKAVCLAKQWGKLLLQAQYFDKEHRAIDLDQIKIKEMTVRTTCGTSDDDIDATFAEIKKRR
ncbi:MAG: medium chain dehydrogenase/reductase family protein, partial [Candidatus Ratteibacteria bacterium]|nr:medium chain dehydrogenase/reductase family protein [Candidatus Ratteibacteria bacterium]